MKLLKEIIRLPAKFTIPAKTQSIQKELLNRVVPAVVDAATQQLAVDVGREIRKLENDVEKLRKDLTKPLVACQREINKICFDYSKPLAERREQLEAAVTGFQQAEAQRVLRETEERSKQIAELAEQKAAETGDVAMDELVAYRQEQQAEELMRLPLPCPVKANGAATRKVMRWECADVNALYAARPDLCNPPTPKASAINSVCVPELPVPGLKLWWEDETIIRTR